MQKGESARIWSIPHLNLQLLHARFITYAFKRHWHDYFVVGVIEAGVQSFWYQRQRHLTPPGGIIVLNPSEMHTGESASDAGFTWRALYPDVSLMQSLASDIADHSQDVPFFSTPVIRDAALSGQFLSLHRALETATSALEHESRFVWTLAQLILRHADARPPMRAVRQERQQIRRVRDYIHDHYADNISLTQLAGLVGWSPFYLLRVFQKEAGSSPHAYLENVRIRQAQQLLLQGTPAAQVAHETGFFDQSHLTNSFRRIIGVTPGQYAQQRKIFQDN